MKRYDTYKPSGIAWIGEVPEHWDVMPFKFRMDINNGMDYKHVQVEDGFPVMGSGGQFAYASQFMYDGEVVLLGRKGTVDKPLYYNGKFWAVDTMFYAIPLNKTCCKYMYYQATTFPFGYYQTSTALPSMTQTDLGNNKVCVPPLAEQEAIAAYLDARCADIDKVVATQQKRIALLHELKQSEITQAVTLGLNPDVRMKDSGVEWMGLVPEHWEVKKLKFVVSCNDDVLNDRTKDDQIIRYVEISDVNSIEGITNSTEYEFKEAPSRARRITKKDDVIVSTVRTYLKAIARVKEDGLIVSTGFAVLRAKNINPNFLAYSTLSELFIGTVISESVGVSYPAINSSDIINIKLPVPPSDEQVVIAEHLDRRCGEIDRQIGAVTRQIELLREYKQALITEVVTGKRRV